MLDLLMKRRSVRKYKEKGIGKDSVDRILQGALTSPSGKNIKPWELVVVGDKEQLKRLGKSRGTSSKPISDATLGIIVISDPQKTDLNVEDSTIIAVIIQLLAEAEGLGSCWVHVRNRMTPWNKSVEEYIKEILHIPEDYVVECMIALGYPDELKKPHNRDDLPYNKIHYDRYR